MSAVRPVCLRCTRNARTVDMPRVKIRVHRTVVFRDTFGLHMYAHCHGDTAHMLLPEGANEDAIERLEVFDNGDG